MAVANAADETDIANQALDRVGAKIVTDVESATDNNALLIARHLADTRDHVQRMFVWNCLVKRDATLVVQATNLTEMTYAYDIPSDYLRIIELHADVDAPIIYRVEGTVVYTDYSAPTMRYVKQGATVTEWDPILVEAIVARLAAILAYKIAGSVQLAQLNMNDYLMTLAAAVDVAIIENTDEVARYIKLYRSAPGLLLQKTGVKE